MKKLVIIFLSMLLLVGCNPTGDENGRPSAIMLNGDSTITLMVGDTYTELGAYVEDDDSINITISGTVDTSVSDTYEITYSYDNDGVTITKKRTVIVEEVTVMGNIILNGDKTITLSVGDTFTDLGAYVEGDSTITVSASGSVNTDVAATYTITYSYTVGDTTKTKTRTVIVEEDSVSCSLIGANNIEMNLGGVFTDPGYMCDPTSTVVSIDDSDLNINVVGTYDILYTYFDGISDITITRIITVVDNTVVFALNGDMYMTIDQNSTWTDPGYTITPTSTTVNVTDTVDTSVPGNYSVTYSYDDGFGTQTHTRDVVVQRTVFFNYTSYSVNNDVLTVDITGIDSQLKYFSFKLELYKDDLFMDSSDIVNGTNSVVFNDCVEGHTYKLVVVGEYYEGSSPTPSKDENVIETLTIEVTISEPEMDVANEVIGVDSYSFDYTITDPESRFLWFDVKVYDGTTLVDDTNTLMTTTSGSINVSGLLDYMDYHVIVILTYDEGTTNIETNIIDKTIKTTVNFSFTAEVESESIYVNEDNNLIVSLNNPNSYSVENIYIDGINQPFSVVDSVTLSIELDTTVVGEFTKAIDSITLKVRGTDEVFSYNEIFVYTIVDQLAPENVPYVTTYFSNDDEYDTRSGGSGHTMQLELNNPLQLEIKDILLDGELLQDIYIYTNNGETITFFDHFEYRVDKHQQNVTGFTYVYGGVEYDVVVDSFNAENIPLCEVGLTQVSTVQDVKDMVTDNTGGCYELVNDIDLSGENWIYSLGSNQNSSITLFGNDYTISNVTMTSSDVASASDTYWGLFRSLSGAHIQDLNITINYSLGNSNNGKLYIGGLTGYMYNSFIENVSVSGTISSNWYTNGYVGGVIGLSVSNVIEDLSISVNVDVNQHTPSISSVLGSVIGEVQNTEIHGYTDTSTLTVTGVISHTNLTYDEPIAVVTSSNIKDAPGT